MNREFARLALSTLSQSRRDELTALLQAHSADPAAQALLDHFAGVDRSEESRRVRPSGAIVGFKTYEELDPGWLIAGAAWVAHALDRHAFNPRFTVIQAPETFTLGVIGDWGTGFYYEDAKQTPAAKVLRAMGAVDYAVHLGDEYYAGSKSEETDHFATLWTGGKRGNFCLNSNHAMYSGAQGYFKRTLAHPTFAAQAGGHTDLTSVFAIVNKEWLILGLDTAIAAKWDDMYLNGVLSDPQLDGIRSLVAVYPGRKVVILSHHNGTDDTGTTINALGAAVKDTLGGWPFLWLWGHVHQGAVFTSLAGEPAQARTLGHGAIPYGPPSELEGQPNIPFYEQRLAKDPNNDLRCVNGGAVYTFGPAGIVERWFDEDGQTPYQTTLAR